MVIERERCVTCQAPRTRGVLCDVCAGGLVPDDLCPEQIGGRDARPDHSANNCWLVDGYGQPHTLAVPTSAASPFRTLSIGRDKKSELWIAERTISLTHASLEHRPLSNAWFVVDHGSDNGVFVNDDRVPRRFPLEPGDRIFLGRRVGFVFMPIEGKDVDAAADEAQFLAAQSWSEDTVGDASVVDVVPLKISIVSEGGAVASWGAERAVLTELEYELIATLHKRMIDDVDVDAAARGFVPAAILLEALTFRSEAPTHANLRGLVRKIRRKLADRDDAVDLIESRQGLGYRLARSLVIG
ncbi:MAG: FHA domain-containing protein [Deltaproteobacteria bacterium]|nr:FHA domain-containing protein [Deltaproteobacteria bacterium]